MKFILITATVLAAFTTQARAYNCVPGLRYCGTRWIGQASDYCMFELIHQSASPDSLIIDYYWGAAVQAAHEKGIPDHEAPYTLFECDTNVSYLKVIKDCGRGNCIFPGGGNNDYCV
jgi:hypothetical protein